MFQKHCDEFELWHVASRKRRTCFHLTRWFLWAPEHRNWARTYNNMTCSVLFGDVSPQKHCDKFECQPQLLKKGPMGHFPLTMQSIWAQECKNCARTHNNLTYCLTPTSCDELERQCAASHKWGLCFTLTGWFLWAPEHKHRARTYNDMACSAFFSNDPPKKLARSWNIDAWLLANEAHVSQ